MKTQDYYINYYGSMIDIKNTNKVLCLFTGGSGFGDGGADRVWSSSYDLYVAKKDILEKVGSAHERGNGYDVYCQFTIKGQEHTIQGFAVDSLFSKISKR